MNEHLQNALKFSEMLNKFRLVDRVMYANGTDRMENDVEHSYQLAMTAWYIASSRRLHLNIGLLLKYALVHDLVEVYAGDTDVFSKDLDYVQTKKEREEMARRQIADEFPEFSDLHTMMSAYESRNDSEADFIFAWDGTHPIFNVFLDNNRLYQEKGIDSNDVRKKRKEKASVSPEIKQYFDGILDKIEREEQGLDKKEDTSINRVLDFSRLLNQFRLVERVVYINNKSRWENDIEHSYQLAMLAWYIASSRKFNLNFDLLIKYALVHDFVEVYAGDTYFMDKAHAESKVARENDAREQIRSEFTEFPDLYEAMISYEKKNDPESRFVYALDKVHAILNIYLCGNQLFKEKEVTAEMLYENKRTKVALSPDVAPYFEEIMKVIQEEGLLFDSK